VQTTHGLPFPYALRLHESVDVSGLPVWNVETPKNLHSLVAMLANDPPFFSPAICNV
jgi:hypothetical protein